MDRRLKKIILIIVAINLVIIGGILAYFQFGGNKIVVEPNKIKVIVPKEDIEEGKKIDEKMVGYKEIYEKDLEPSAITDISKIKDYKARIKLRKHMQLQEYMLQSQEEQFKEGCVKVSIDLKNIGNLVANQIQPNDYINLNLVFDKSSKMSKMNIESEPKVVLSKRKIIDLVDSSGIARSKFDTSKREFKAQYLILELNEHDYKKYKCASAYSTRYDGQLELTLHDPTQKAFVEDFNIGSVDRDIVEQVEKETVTDEINR